MIVEPDFFDHWKTKRLIELTKDPASPLMLLRLWAYCQSRRKWRFHNLAGEPLRAVCCATIDAKRWQEALNECRFIREENGVLIVHDWDQSNRYLVSCWKNGTKGGRPHKTDRIPTANRKETHSKPTETDPSNLSNLSVQVQKRFKEWIPVRKAMGKAPKDWKRMFEEQVKWLEQYQPSAQLEIISASIRNNWQGLHPPKNGVKATSLVAPPKPKYLPVARKVSDEELEHAREIAKREKAVLANKLRPGNGSE